MLISLLLARPLSFSFLFWAAFYSGVQARSAKDNVLTGQQPKNEEEVTRLLEKGSRLGRLPLWTLLIGVGAFQVVVVINLSF
jgi:hypothetical protein